VLPPELQNRSKLIVAALMVATLILLLVFLQQQFDNGDFNRAIGLLTSKSPGSQWSVAEEMVQRAGNKPLDCEPKLLSSFQGTLEVTCQSGSAAMPYRFHVDLVRKTVNAMDDHTRELIQTAQEKGKAAPLLDAGLERSPVDAGLPAPADGGP
jgi:hypothetical protein